MTGQTITREQAFANARRVLDAARDRRDRDRAAGRLAPEAELVLRRRLKTTEGRPDATRTALATEPREVPIVNTPESTATAPSTTDAEKHRIRTAVIARQLDQIAPGAARVRTVPVTTDRDGEQRLATWVALDDALGGPVKASRDAHHAARGLLLRMFPGADWTRPQIYDAITGDLALDEPAMPEELNR